MNRKRGFWIALWVALVVITGLLALAYGPMGMGYGPWHGWGRMGAWDGDRDYRGSGMPAWYGMGPGMMGNHGRMMMGMGFGMGGDDAMMSWRLPDLTPEQAGKIGQLHDELARRDLGLMQQGWKAQTRLNGLYAAEKRDWNAIRTASQTLFDLQRQHMDAALDVQQKIDGLLTDSQRRAMAAAWRGRGWMGGQRHDWQNAE